MSKKKKIPQILKQIKNQPLREMNYAFEKAISYSQFSVYQNCPRKWSLQYRDGHYTSESSIHMTFGTALHETLQHYLTTIYEVSGAAADRIDLKEYFEERFRETYLKDYKSNNNIHFSDSVEMNEFFEDGIAILEFVKKKRGGYFGKRGWYLVGCEVPILLNPHPEFKTILYKGYLDVVLYHEATNTFKILDIKTSRSGWDDKTKKDETKQLQLILYKKFYSQQFGVPEDNISVEFFIVKRKVMDWDDEKILSPHQAYRVQTFIPASGKIKITKAKESLNNFIKKCFNTTGEVREEEYPKVVSKWNCMYCPFKEDKDNCGEGIIF